MLRFIDLRDQILDVEDSPVHFAFYDTASSVFVELGGTQDWCSREDFIGDHARSGVGQQYESRRLTRFLSIMPGWVV